MSKLLQRKEKADNKRKFDETDCKSNDETECGILSSNLANAKYTLQESMECNGSAVKMKKIKLSVDKEIPNLSSAGVVFFKSK